TRIRAVTANFADLAQVLADPDTRRWIDDPPDGDPGGDHVVGVLFDLGVSSHQLDVARRGFSYRATGPLDMRMGDDAARTAADIVNGSDRGELVGILRRFGEERFAGRIADAIIRHRPLDDTTGLAAVVAGAVPAAARRSGHPARRVFQAIRIAVNGELDAIAAGLDAAIAAVDPRGRIVVIAYHSLEDRIVKRRFAGGAKGCVCPPDLPMCACDATQELRLLTRRPRRPGLEETARNPRARSALLRAAERMAA
ncbi:MAG: 16S rRNA (cytosine(1402)-N(4))-methyltransferase RsmH, partial [Actinomycetota bacterium]|nr:16S rRNA (cytosine(1402)-N(4))-methyltransferase RsmH [Actinomycetota bacterium]